MLLSPVASDEDDPCDVEHDQRAERRGDRGERVGAPPQQGERDDEAHAEHDRSPREIVADHRLHE